MASYFFDSAELLVWLDIEWPICKKRLEKRGSESKKHLDRQQSEDGLKKLIKWASHYYDRPDFRSYVGHRMLFRKFLGKKVHLKSETEVNKLVENAQQGATLDFNSVALHENQ